MPNSLVFIQWQVLGFSLLLSQAWLLQMMEGMHTLRLRVLPAEPGSQEQ